MYCMYVNDLCTYQEGRRLDTYTLESDALRCSLMYYILSYNHELQKTFNIYISALRLLLFVLYIQSIYIHAPSTGCTVSKALHWTRLCHILMFARIRQLLTTRLCKSMSPLILKHSFATSALLQLCKATHQQGVRALGSHVYIIPLGVPLYLNMQLSNLPNILLL